MRRTEAAAVLLDRMVDTGAIHSWRRTLIGTWLVEVAPGHRLPAMTTRDVQLFIAGSLAAEPRDG